MAILPLQLARVSNLLSSTVAQNAIDSTQSSLLEVENELSTGKRVNVPSDDPAAASVIQNLQKTLQQRQAYASNITTALSNLGQTDSTLGDLKNLLDQAQSIASANVGSDVTDAQRQSASAIVQSIYNQVLTLSNSSLNGQYIFGGDNGAQQPFVEKNGAVVYTGSGLTLDNQFDESTSLSFQVDGQAVFGGFSSRVQGSADLTPSLTSTTLLSSLRGANNTGVQLGSIVVSNGTVSKVVDLSKANTVGDVVGAINAAGVGTVTASVGTSGITLTGGAGENISVKENGGATATDLGILNTAGAGVGVPLAGGAIRPNVTGLTPVASLRNGAGINNSGLVITNGQTTKTITWPAGATVEDMLNAINGAGLNVRAQIDSNGTGIDVMNISQGTNLSIGENGGTTATDLGVRSMDASTPLAELNFGKGVGTVAGGDFKVNRTDGTSFTVSLTGAKTVQDAINAINAADAGGGVTASLATTGNGITLNDASGGAQPFTVTPLNYSTAAADLGLTTPASGNVIKGADVDQVKSNGIFGQLQDLIKGLQTSNQSLITQAGQDLATSSQNAVTARGVTGAREQELQNRQSTMSDENIATQKLLSDLQDTNFTDAITKFQTLQTALQASLQTTAKTLSLNLMDFLG